MKSITMLDKSCDRCGLPLFNCICGEVYKFVSTSRFYLLVSEKEIERPSNTGRLLKLVNYENTEIIVWKRKEIDKSIEEIIHMENTFLVFPALNEEDNKREIAIEPNSTFLKDKSCNFIIIDSTWQEAKKIVRKSDYLKRLPLLNLKIDKTTEFKLRRGTLDGTMCTLEVISELLKLNNNIIQGEKTDELLKLFMDRYIAGRNGHKVK